MASYTATAYSDAGGRQLSSLRAPSGQLSLGVDTTQVVEVDTCSPSSACSKEVGPATDRQTGASRVRNDGRDTADAGTTLCRAGERPVSSRGNVRGCGDRDTWWHGVLVAKRLVSSSIHTNKQIENIWGGSVHSCAPGNICASILIPFRVGSVEGFWLENFGVKVPSMAGWKRRTVC